MISCCEANCTYFGHQLKSYAKGGTTISYKYDSDGLRTRKTVNGVNHDYYYVDGMLMYEKHGDEYELFYRYDNDGRPQMVMLHNFNETGFANYSAVTNSQGDIIKLLSGAGAVRVNTRMTHGGISHSWIKDPKEIKQLIVIYQENSNCERIN